MAVKIVDSKIDCQLLQDNRVIDALLHLIEIVYNERITFWNAVMELTDESARSLGVFDQHPTLGVRLADGRTGFLEITHCTATGEYFELAGVGKPN